MLHLLEFQVKQEIEKKCKNCQPKKTKQNQNRFELSSKKRKERNKNISPRHR
jgi:hypothetical protein